MSYLVQRRNKLREMLRAAPDGLTIPAMLAVLPPVDDRVIYNDLKSMPDVYIDRWSKTYKRRGNYEAVWCVVVPPPDCPRPDEGV